MVHNFTYYSRYVLFSSLLLLWGKTMVCAQYGFLENKGQYDESIIATAQFDGYKLGISVKGFEIITYNQEEWAKLSKYIHDYEYLKDENAQKSFEVSYHKINYEFIGANWLTPNFSEDNEVLHNFYLGDNPQYWASGVKKYNTLIFKDFYPKIDLELKVDGPRFKYNFILHPKANPEHIKIKINGAPIKVKDKKIEIFTEFGTLQDRIPVSYWMDANGEKLENEDVSFVIKDQLIYFKLPTRKLFSKPNSSNQLVIDPELIFATYSGSTVDNFGFTATYDEYGNGYAGGIVLDPVPLIPGGRFPATAGSFSATYMGGEESNIFGVSSPCDITISKYNAIGSQLIYATYLGGTKNEHPHSLIVDENDNLVVMGTVFSNNFPTTNGAYLRDKNDNSSDIFVSKFNSDGSTLLGSTYIGGVNNDGLNTSKVTNRFYADDFRGEVIVDRAGNIYVASVTESPNFPTTNQAFQRMAGGNQDGVVFSFSPDLNELLWSSYLGGSDIDAVYTVDLTDDEQFIFVSGGTNSSDLPKTGDVYQSDIQGDADGFITKISSDGSSIERLTYLGTNSHDQIFSLELDKYGNVFVIGQSLGEMPVTGNVYSNPGGRQFICKLDSNLSSLLISNVFGSGKPLPDMTINAFLVDECGKIFVSGWGADVYRPSLRLSGMPLSANAVQRTTDGNDFYLCVFGEDLENLVYGSYFGGNRTGDHVDGGTSRFDKRGVIYQSVCASCPGNRSGPNRVSDFPTTPNAYSVNNPSPRCSNVLFKFGFENLNNKPELNDTLLTVKMLDTLFFEYTVTDPDGDTIFVDYNLATSLRTYFEDFIPKDTARREVSQSFTFIPICDLVGDTIRIPVDARDLGCPFHLDNNATISIVVAPPDLLKPPEVFCLTFTENDEALNLSWEAIPEINGFQQLHLYKIWPDGREERLKSFNQWGAGSYQDSDVINPRTNEYQYYFVVENICDSLGPLSYYVNSAKEGEAPVLSTAIKTVSVEDSLVHIIWLKSLEDDFQEYQLFKRERGSADWKLLTIISSIDDTIYVDKTVDVSNLSFCYAIRVGDVCGNMSSISNYGCNIVLSGRPQPFEFLLNWQLYEEWDMEVDRYELSRSVDTGSLRLNAIFPSKHQGYIDNDLDYDWGGYWYQIVAYERSGGLDAISKSNKIYLIQPPLLWVPNAVTANDDWLNDDFGWSDVFVYDFNMKIFNRWGEKVFETNDKNARWDGMSKKSELKHSEVYMWIATYTGWDRTFHRQKGTVTVLR